jgi:hypothetical protein
MTKNRKPAAPPGLRTGGRRLWADVVAGWDLRPDELIVLERACRVRDRLDRLDAALAKAPDVVDVGSRGQARVHPAVSELRQQELVLAGLLDRLRLTEPSAEGPVGGRSTAARELALRRWRG